ncbi:MAG: hypothetical protein K6F49_10910 [Saccharofermentans sp.]|nr:hypothetical protein [Saccharofermentans sp.]
MTGSYAQRKTEEKKRQKAAAGWLVAFAVLVTGMLAVMLTFMASMHGLIG